MKNEIRPRAPTDNLGTGDAPAAPPASCGDNLESVAFGQKLLGFLTAELQHLLDRILQVGDALFPGFALAVGLGKLHAGRSETRFAIERAVVPNRRDIHGKTMMVGARGVKRA